MSKSLYVVPDGTSHPQKRYIVKDESENIPLITDLGDLEAKKTATLWAMRRGEWGAGS